MSRNLAQHIEVGIRDYANRKMVDNGKYGNDDAVWRTLDDLCEDAASISEYIVQNWKNRDGAAPADPKE